MTKLEKVIKGLEICIGVQDGDVCPNECPYRKDICAGTLWLMADALALLKEQEPRVMTLEEVLSQAWDYCYIEAQVRPHSKMLEMLCGTHRLYCTTSTVLERQNRGDSEYGKTWRCWSARPTDEQREAVKWE